MINLIKELELTGFFEAIKEPRLEITNNNDLKKVLEHPDFPKDKVLVVCRAKANKPVHNIPLNEKDNIWVYSTAYLRELKKDYNVEFFNKRDKYYGLAVVSKKKNNDNLVIQPKELKEGEVPEPVKLESVDTDGKVNTDITHTEANSDVNTSPETPDAFGTESETSKETDSSLPGKTKKFGGRIRSNSPVGSSGTEPGNQV